MGCTNSTKRQESEGVGVKPNGNGLKNLFYATNEFDLSTSGSENEDEILSVKSFNKNKNDNNTHIQKLTKEINGLSNGLITENINSSTTNSTLLDNRLHQTCV